MNNTYSSLPQHLLTEYYPPQSVLTLLQNNPEQTFTAKQICQELRIHEKDPTCPSLRRTITELILSGHSIVSGRKGFSYTTNPQRIASCVEQLTIRIGAIQKKVEAYQKMTGWA